MTPSAEVGAEGGAGPTLSWRFCGLIENAGGTVVSNFSGGTPEIPKIPLKDFGIENYPKDSILEGRFWKPKKFGRHARMKLCVSMAAF